MIISAGCADGCPPCGENCDFTYKRFGNPPDDADVVLPDVIYRPAMDSDSLHIADSGHVLAGDRVYDADGTYLFDVPSLPAANAKWLWIYYDQSIPEVTLYAAHRQTTGSSPNLFVNLRVWRWNASTSTTTLMIDEDFLVSDGAGPGSTFIPGSPPTFAYHRNTAVAGSFDSPPSSKLGDVRRGRIVIAGAACWYNEGSSAEFEYNSQITCWDLNGVQQWQANLGDFYGSDSIAVYQSGSSGPTTLVDWDSHNHYAGFPKPLRVRIGKYSTPDSGSAVYYTDLGVYVLTTHSRTPDAYGFKWSDDFARYLDGDSAPPCLWKITDNVAGVQADVFAPADRQFYGRSDGIDWGQSIALENGDPVYDPDLVPPKLSVSNPDADTYGLAWTAASGGIGPYVYDVMKDAAVFEANNIAFATTDGPTTKAVLRTYAIRVTDSSVPPLVSTSNSVTAYVDADNVKTCAARDFDVSPVGNALVALRTANGDGLVKVSFDPSVNADTSDTDENGTRVKGFSETYEYTYPEQTPEFAGPAHDTASYPSVLDPPTWPNSSDGTHCYILRSAGNDTTDLMQVSFLGDPSLGYQVERKWACGQHPALAIETAPLVVNTDGLGNVTSVEHGEIHTMTDGVQVPDPDGSCGPCPAPDPIVTACMLILTVSFAFDDFKVCLAETDDNEWTGVKGRPTQWQGTWAEGKTLTFRVYYDAGWKLSINDGTETGVYSWDSFTADPPSGFLSDTLGNLGDGAAFMASLAECCEGGAPFWACCADLATCCMDDDDTITAQGVIEESAPGSCTDPCSTSIVQWGWNYSNPTTSTGNLWAAPRYHWRGPLGFDDQFGTMSGYEGIHSCAGPGWEAVAVDSATGDPVANGSYDPGFVFCATPSGTITWDLPTDACCAGGAGTFKTQF